MLEFETLSDLDQAAILARLLARLGDARCNTIDDLADKRDSAVTQIWIEVCQEAGAPICTLPSRLRRT